MFQKFIPHHRREGEPLPPPWYGGLAMVIVLASFGWLIAYCWGGIPVAESLGPWTYLATFGMLAGGIGLIELWRTLH